MALMGSLSEKLSHVFSKLKNKGALTELEIKNAMREIRVALLEADVNFAVAKEFINKVSERAVGDDILKGLNSSQQVVKIVNEELIALMGSTHQKLTVADRPPTVILMSGLQGAGKTTMCGKLALNLKKNGKRPLLVACDIYRPAAIQQLKIVGEKAGAEVYSSQDKDAVKIAKEGVKYATSQGYDTVIIDTAGRLHIDQVLMKEIKDIRDAVKPTEILLVIDSMLGQDAVNVAKEFNEALEITGVILTKLDGDTRGGAALSVKAVTGKPIKFIGVGEKMTDLEPFYPDRMASRLLGMGDVLTLIERAQEAINEEDALRIAKKMKDKSFDLNDYLEQLSGIKNMGNLSDMIGMIPGMSNKLRGQNLEVDEKKIEQTKAIITSMTPKERKYPEILNASRRKRIAKGSGVEVADVNRLINQFEQMKKMMAKMSSGKMRFPF